MELKIGKKTEDALILEVIFVTLTENSSVVKNNTQGTLEISTPQEIAVRPHFHVRHGTTQYFYLLIEKPFGRYFQVWSPYYQAAQCYHKTPLPVSSKRQVRSEKAKKR